MMSEVRSVELLGAAVFTAPAGGAWDLLLSCPLDVDGAEPRAAPVEEGVDVRKLVDGAAWVGVVPPLLLATLHFFFCQHSN